VAWCEKANKKLSEVDLSEFKKYSPVIKSDVYDSLGAANVANRYVTAGASGVKQTRERIVYWRKRLAGR